MRELKGIKWEAILTEILFILLGVVLLFNPETTAKTICYIFGTIMIAVGVVKIMAYFFTKLEDNLQSNNFVAGTIIIMIGLLFVIKAKFIISIIPFIMGIFVILSGFSKLQAVFNIRRMKSGGYIGLLIIAVINIALGIFLLFQPFKAAKTMFRIIGACMIFSGATDLFNVVYMSRKVSNYIKDMQALEQDDEE